VRPRGLQAAPLSDEDLMVAMELGADAMDDEDAPEEA
jgi:hypothetical protein